MKITDTHIYFWGSYLSNFYPCEIKMLIPERDNFYTFSSSEQLFMYFKATKFEDKEIMERILNSSTPKEAKKLGRKIKEFDENIWNKSKEDLMFIVLLRKFMQNEVIQKKLIDTGNKILVEASPYDKIWGVGLSEDDPLILDEKNWLGENLLGKTLIEIRRYFKKIS